jgi:hypothetical protein
MGSGPRSRCIARSRWVSRVSNNIANGQENRSTCKVHFMRTCVQVGMCPWGAGRGLGASRGLGGSAGSATTSRMVRRTGQRARCISCAHVCRWACAHGERAAVSVGQQGQQQHREWSGEPVNVQGVFREHMCAGGHVPMGSHPRSPCLARSRWVSSVSDNITECSELSVNVQGAFHEHMGT